MRTSRLKELLQKIAAMQPQPEVHIRGDVRADYEADRPAWFHPAQQAGIAQRGLS